MRSAGIPVRHRIPRVMTHVFPTASEYDSVYRLRQHRRKVALMTLSIMVISALVAFVFKSAVLVTRATNGSIVKHGSFEVIQHIVIDEIQSDVIIYRHKRSKTQVLTIVPTDTDQDSVFGISFRTLPTSDNGANHVLRRSILDGSVNYPVRRPFHELKKGSLQTYLESFTFQDRTVYAAASRNRPDFVNLVRVSLDAVFNPLCVTDAGKWIFRQEGWRLERVNKKTREHEFNGNAFNEMRGIYGDPDELIQRYARRSLFEDTHYGFDAQGEPGEIITLTREHMIDVYNKFYHPTNAQVFLYGNVDYVSDGLDELDSHLRHYKARFDISEDSKPSWQELNLKSGVEEQHAFPSTVNTENRQIMMSWIINQGGMDPKTELAWLLLEYLLMGTPSSSLRGALEKLKFGDEVIGGLDTRYQQWRFSVGMKAVAEDQTKKLQQSIINTLEALVDTGGFHVDQIAAAANYVELRLRDQSSGGVPRGVRLMFQAYSKWTYGENPGTFLAFEDTWTSLIDDIKAKGSAPFIKLISNHILANKHYCVIELFPKWGVVLAEDTEFQAQIAQMKETLSEEDFTKLLADSSQLQQIQQLDDPADAIATIPSLELKDIDRTVRPNTLDLRVVKDVLIASTRVKNSFGMLFVDFGIDLRPVAFPDLFLVPLVSRLMMITPTKAFSEHQLNVQISKYSSGIESTTMIQDVRPHDASKSKASFIVNDGSYLSTKLFFRGACKAGRLGPFLTIFSEIIFNGEDFTQEQTAALVGEIIEEYDVEMIENGGDLVARRVEARYSMHGGIEETIHGFGNLILLTQLAREIPDHWPEVKERLLGVRSAIIGGHRNGMVLSLTGEAQGLEDAQAHIQKFVWQEIPRNDHAEPFPNPNTGPHPWAFDLNAEKDILFPIRDEGIIVPSAVAYIGKGATLFEKDQSITGSISVVAKYMESGYLYNTFIENFGAFGATAKFEYQHATLIFVISRDPNRRLVESLSKINDAPNALSRDILNFDDLPKSARQAIIATIGELDGPAPQPNQIGWDFLKEFLRGESSEYRQLWRNQILNTTRNDFVDFTNKLLEWETPTVAAISTQQEFKAAEDEDGVILHTLKVRVV